ncbi:unnamed protein product, partial [Adineta steineri]
AISSIMAPKPSSSNHHHVKQPSPCQATTITE